MSKGNAYLAQEASFRSGEYVVAGNKAAWLELFADDAVVEDPVGVSPLDPTGLGHRGREAISAFWDQVIGPGNIQFNILSSHPAGDQCANVVDLVNTLADDVQIETRMVVVYTANDEGRLTSLKAYWEYSKVEEQLSRALGAG